jgi:hypothetical protein
MPVKYDPVSSGGLREGVSKPDLPRSLIETDEIERLQFAEQRRHAVSRDSSLGGDNAELGRVSVMGVEP